MHMRLWAAEGFLGSAVALMLTYLLVEPESLMSGYAGVIGWSTITVFLILMLQGFWIRNRHPKISDESNGGPHTSYQLAIFKWGGMHSAMSIVVTVFLIIHGFLLLPQSSRTKPRTLGGSRSVRNIAHLEPVRATYRIRKEIAKFRPTQENPCLVNACSSNSLGHTRGRRGAITEFSFHPARRDSGFGRLHLVEHYHSVDGSDWTRLTRS